MVAGHLSAMRASNEHILIVRIARAAPFLLSSPSMNEDLSHQLRSAVGLTQLHPSSEHIPIVRALGASGSARPPSSFTDSIQTTVATSSSSRRSTSSSSTHSLLFL